MQALKKLYKLLNILSLDIVAGAVICALFFAKVFSVVVLPFGLATLGLTVWIIYTTDHLFDAVSIKKEASTERHRFHQRYFNILLVCVVIVLILDSVLIFYIRPQVFKWGLILGCAVGLYLLVQRYLKFLKEIFVACMYTAGILLPSITITDLNLTYFHWIMIAQFALLALGNLLIFSWFDIDQDWKDNQHSFVTVFGKGVTEKIIWILLVLNFIIGLAVVYEYVIPEIILLLMNAGLFFLFFFRKRYQQNDVYRIIGDSVFLIPVLYLL